MVSEQIQLQIQDFGWIFVQPKSTIFLDFIDPARAPKSDPVGATGKSSSYGTIKNPIPTRKSALEIAARTQLGAIDARMKGKMEFSGAGPVFGALGWNVQTPSFGTSELRSGCRDPQRTHTHTHTHTHSW